jgi:hypothetical protein
MTVRTLCQTPEFYSPYTQPLNSVGSAELFGTCYHSMPEIQYSVVFGHLHPDAADFHSPHSVNIFRMQNKIVRIMMGCSSRVSCRNLFKSLEILPLVSQHILFILLFAVKNKNLFIINSEIHSQNTGQVSNFYPPITNLTVYQKVVYCIE